MMQLVVQSDLVNGHLEVGRVGDLLRVLAWGISGSGSPTISLRL